MTDAHYISRAPRQAVRCDGDVWSYGRESLEVIVSSDDPVDTGLVDQHGVPIVRLSLKGALGFCR